MTGYALHTISTTTAGALGGTERAAELAARVWEKQHGLRVVRHERYKHSRPDQFMVGLYWQRPVPEEFPWHIDVENSERGRRAGTLRPEIRHWLDRNLPKGATRTMSRWLLDGDEWWSCTRLTMVCFRDQTDAAMFRLSWL